MNSAPTLTLIGAAKSRGGEWGRDDFDVYENCRVVGRIMRHPQAPKDRPWFWTITARLPQTPEDRGYSVSRSQAMTDFKARWVRPPGANE